MDPGRCPRRNRRLPVSVNGLGAKAAAAAEVRTGPCTAKRPAAGTVGGGQPPAPLLLLGLLRAVELVQHEIEIPRERIEVLPHRSVGIPMDDGRRGAEPRVMLVTE